MKTTYLIVFFVPDAPKPFGNVMIEAESPLAAIDSFYDIMWKNSEGAFQKMDDLKDDCPILNVIEL
jgi:hypothetical protein